MSKPSACLYRSIQQLVDRITSSLIALSVLSLFAACASCEGHPPASEKAAQLSSFGGAERDYEFYSNVLRNCDQLAGRLSADEYELLWESAFCYRDRRGAEAIARAIPKERSPFWRACFEILAEGREDTPLSLGNVSNEDIPEKRSFVFLCLFPGKDLLGKVGLGMLSGRGMTKSGTLFTVYDAFLASTRHDFWEYSGYPSSSAKELFRIMRLEEAARLGYATCHYLQADQWTKAVLDKYNSIPENQRRDTYWPFLPVLMYYSGQSIRVAAPNILESSDKTRFYLLPGEMRDAEVDLVLKLSKEKEALRGGRQ
jgi:hypothetical protein